MGWEVHQVQCPRGWGYSTVASMSFIAFHFMVIRCLTNNRCAMTSAPVCGDVDCKNNVGLDFPRIGPQFVKITM